MSCFEIVYATKNDCSDILSFINLLAEYENMSKDVVATEELLKEWIFEMKKAEVIFGLEDGKKVKASEVGETTGDKAKNAPAPIKNDEKSSYKEKKD